MIRINTGAEGLPIIPPDRDKSKKVEEIEKSRGAHLNKRHEEDTFELSPEAEKELEKEKDEISSENE